MAAGATYEPIQTYTLGSATNSITFSSIAASWTDLKIILVAQDSSTGGTRVDMRFNSDTNNYSFTRLYGTGASAVSTRSVGDDKISVSVYGAPASPIFSLYEINLLSYAGSTFKTCLISASEDSNSTNGIVARFVGLWRNTNAITSVSLYEAGGNFNTGTTATLYGIKNA